MGNAEEYDPLGDEQLAAAATEHLKNTLSSENARTKRSLEIVPAHMVARLAVAVSAQEQGRELGASEIAVLGKKVKSMADRDISKGQD